MSDKIRAIVAEQNDEGKVSASLQNLELSDLPDEDVLIDVAYSTVNYKDGLAVTGTLPICRKFPMVCGIDLSGTVVESKHPKWKAGDRVLANGYALSEDYWGGYAERQRVNGDFLVRVPDAFDLEQVMALGTAGYTAMLCVHAVVDHGTKPEDGPVLVTGAAGGVGSVAVMAMAKLGYEVAASTGRDPRQQHALSDPFRAGAFLCAVSAGVAGCQGAGRRRAFSCALPVGQSGWCGYLPA